MLLMSIVRSLLCILFVSVGIVCLAQTKQPTIEDYRRKIVGVEQIVTEFDRLKRDPKYLAEMHELRTKIKAELSGLYALSQSHPGYSLGALNVREMFARFDNVYVGMNLKSLPFQADLERDSDLYLPGLNLAILNPEIEKASPIGRLGVLIHVMFGASGFDDETYQRTLAVLIAEEQIRNPQHRLYKTINIQDLFPSSPAQLLYQPPQGDRKIIEFSDDANKRVIIAKKNQQKETLMANGGFTGVGGGGDSSAFTVKYEMIQINPIELLNDKAAAKCIQPWRNYTNYLLDVLNVPMESLVGSRNVHMHSSDKGRSIAVPKTYGYSSEAMRDLAVQGIEVLCRNKYIYPAW